MSDKQHTQRFSAYSADEGSLADFAPIRAERTGRVAVPEREQPEGGASGRRLRSWFAVFTLVSVTALLINHNRGVIADFIAMYAQDLPVIDLPALNLPDFKRPVINRAITTVRIESPLNFVTEHEIRTTLATYTDSGFLGVDVQDLKSELESNPWVLAASVRRLWPDVLVIHIVEQEPVARWGDLALLNTYGDVFVAPRRGQEDTLPLLSGPDGTHDLVLEAFADYAGSLTQIEQGIDELHVDSRGSWTLMTTAGMTLRLGRHDPQPRLDRFVSLYRKGLAQELAGVTHVDLRYRNGFSVSTDATPAGALVSR